MDYKDINLISLLSKKNKLICDIEKQEIKKGVKSLLTDKNGDYIENYMEFILSSLKGYKPML